MSVTFRSERVSPRPGPSRFSGPRGSTIDWRRHAIRWASLASISASKACWPTFSRCTRAGRRVDKPVDLLCGSPHSAYLFREGIVASSDRLRQLESEWAVICSIPASPIPKVGCHQLPILPFEFIVDLGTLSLKSNLRLINFKRLDFKELGQLHQDFRPFVHQGLIDCSKHGDFDCTKELFGHRILLDDRSQPPAYIVGIK